MFSQIIAQVRRGVESGLQFVQQKISAWTKPNTVTVAVGALADLTRTKPELNAENALLRQQLMVLQRSVKRPKLTAGDRWLLVLLASRVRRWNQALVIIQPDTLRRWHRDLFTWLWRRKSQAKTPRQ